MSGRCALQRSGERLLVAFLSAVLVRVGAQPIRQRRRRKKNWPAEFATRAEWRAWCKRDRESEFHELAMDTAIHNLGSPSMEAAIEQQDFLAAMDEARPEAA